MTQFIFTSDPHSGQMAYNEIKEALTGCRLLSFLQPGAGLVACNESFEAVSALIDDKSVFVRHLSPVCFMQEWPEEGNEIPATTIFMPALIHFIETNMATEGTFSIQTRLYVTDAPFKKNMVNELLATHLIGKGHLLDVKQPDIVVSVVIAATGIYAGLSSPKLNLSPWPGGECRYKKEDNMISRAEFKLMEALEVFDIKIDNVGKALDLGAAPGGWSRVLAAYGIKVDAVDPAKLDARLNSYKCISHHQCLAQEFLKNHHEYDLIVNDMKMDAFESIDVMKIASQNLQAGGLAIMTLKLRAAHTQTQLNKALFVLRKYFRIINARQLYHNRTEVTVVLRRI